MIPATATLPVPAVAAPERLPRRERARVLRRERDRLFREGRHAEALQVALQVVHLDPGRESRYKAGCLYREVGRHADALKALHAALRYRTGPKRLVPEIHLHLAYVWFLLRKPRRMRECLARAYAARPMPRSAGKFLIMLGNECLGGGRFEEALVHYARAEDASRRTGDVLLRGRAIHNQGLAALRLGRLGDARHFLDRAIRLADKRQDAVGLAIARVMRAGIHLDEGRLGRALELVRHAARAFRELGKRDLEAQALLNVGQWAGEMGLYTESRKALMRGIELAESAGRVDQQALLHACRAATAARQHFLSDAQSDVARARELLRGRDFPMGELFLARAEARVAEAVGDRAKVVRIARRAEAIAERMKDRARVEEFRRLRGRAGAGLVDRSNGGVPPIYDLASPAMRVTVRAALKLAPTDIPVLILGESATGKTTLARFIHRAGRRARGRLVVVPCESLTFPIRDLLGHARGAYTGATRRLVGYVERARGGTLVLDRLDLLPSEGQAALLRAVDERSFRIIATAEDPSTIRNDLIPRIAGKILRVPSLRERREDIPLLAMRFLEGRRGMTLDAQARLGRHPWEGNLAELRAVVDRLVVHSRETIGRPLVERILATPDGPSPRPSSDKLRRPRRLVSKRPLASISTS